ncbi:hypothetical protein WS95_04130 [Burkholderia sp. MSMB1826]|nr:hypothetical protein WS95_04130 [Burkholderia sp. MSMB1826]
MTEALMVGNMKLAMQDLLKTADDVVKTATDVETSATLATLQGLQELHLGKGLDKALAGVEKGVKSVQNDVNKGVDAAVQDLVSSVEGVIAGSVNAVKDLAHGNFGAMMGDLTKVGEDALEVAADLTPEGLTATVAASTLAAAHIGSAALDNAIAGAMHGGIGQVVKAVGETEVSQHVQELAGKAIAHTDPDTATAAGGTLLALGAMGSASGARRSARTGKSGDSIGGKGDEKLASGDGLNGVSGQKNKEKFVADDEPKSAVGKKNEDEATSGNGPKGTEKSDDKDKSKDKNDSDKGQDGKRAGSAPPVLDTLLLSYLADNHRRTD